MRAKRTRYIPEGATRINGINPELKLEIYTYERDGVPIAIAYGGKRTKADFHYNLGTAEKRTDYIAKFVEGRQRILDYNNEQKAIKKAQNAEAVKNLKVGDVFHCGWGYDQTQCDFYQLVALKGITGTFRPVYAATVEGSENYDSDRRVACVDDFKGPEFKKRLNGERFTVNSYSSASKCDPKDSFMCTWGR